MDVRVAAMNLNCEIPGGAKSSMAFAHSVVRQLLNVLLAQRTIFPLQGAKFELRA